MLENAESVFSRYISGNIVTLKAIDTSHDETDKRFTYIIDTDAGEHIAVKLCNNCFTTPERISEWKRLINLYNELGIYAPKIISDKDGCICSRYFENNERYIVYAEEKKKYKTTEEYGFAPNDCSVYLESMVKAEANVAKHSTTLPTFKTAWCLYDLFSDDDETDETYYWQYEFYTLVTHEMPMFKPRAERIWKRFSETYQSFESQYQALPQAFFQGDAGGLNTMLDENKEYVGLLDFNLAGAEIIMNYFFRVFCRVPIRKEEIFRLNEESLRSDKDAQMRKRLDLVKKYYQFSSAEKAAFPTYYKVAYPLECDNSQMFQAVVREKDPHKLELVLDWIEYQQTRDDIFL